MRVWFSHTLQNYHRLPWAQWWQECLWMYEQAEALGFDGLLVQEHFFTADGYGPSMPIFLAMLAERTHRARIGSNVYVLPLHNPAALAQETAVLDHLSGGRLDVGIGMGHRGEEFRAFGMDPRTRVSRMQESITALRGAWTEQPFSFAGRYYEFDNLVSEPRPLQQPHPPLWMASTAPASARRAGLLGMHLRGGGGDPAIFEAYRAGLLEGGHEPAQFFSSAPWSITTTYEDPDAVFARNREYYVYRWDFYVRIRREFGDPEIVKGLPADDDPYRAQELIGTPDHVTRVLRRLTAERGLTDLVYSGPGPGIPLRGEGYDALALFAETVLPTVHAW